ncbi:DUF1636 domain-containing protein [Paracoccus sp. 11-3]|uniref:DUF1636 domain-containing protein n=1 Tax=Paracoccus amoyensis TaxID=2760093 RepID=A0A926GET4_9RHOB|nr:DUF1636 domain-containing protein [Paracoccus amoyensis]
MGSTEHSIIVCNRCPGMRGEGERPGPGLAARLRALLGDDPAATCRVGEIACMAGCDRPLAVAFTAPGKASYLFGDVDAERDAPHLIAFARLYCTLPDGWSNERQRPRGLAGKTLARIPVGGWR